MPDCVVTLAAPVGAAIDLQTACAAVLTTLPDWFGQPQALATYAEDAARWPTWLARDADGAVCGFVTLREHHPGAWEVHCLGVCEAQHGRGWGRQLLDTASAWARARGGRWLQVKTLAAEHPSTAYANTRAFYLHMGFTPLETFPALWGPHLPCVQMLKAL
ncbi:MAG: GNAT family N-acetyltransferase [Proteobacteria bacterium]|nr:GNAT family N-acetyltransferase [Pseudomonadota bacterium]